MPDQEKLKEVRREISKLTHVDVRIFLQRILSHMQKSLF